MENVTKSYEWIGGDGGPIIVLQAAAVPLWQGASDFDNSLMAGGTVETDYDVICDTDGSITSLHRYERDMLVLGDSAWGARFLPSDVGEVVILQWYGWDDDDEALLRHLLASSPSYSLSLTIEDTTLRLLWGATSGNTDWHPVSDVAVSPGAKVCEVYISDAGQMVILRPIPTT